MSTTFFEKHLFNDASQKHDTAFTPNGKEWEEGMLEREREGERVECGRRRVAEKELRRES
jgi:hypothetical protein